MLALFAGIARERPEARLVVANDGSLAASLQRQVGRLGLTARVQFVGRQEDFKRPTRAASRLRSAAYGANIEIAPNKVRLLLEFSRRYSGARLTRADSYLAQLQAQF